MIDLKHLKIKHYDYFIVFMDSNNSYLIAYGYNHLPSILEMKYAIETLSKDEELIDQIPNLIEILDFICFDIMTYEEFVTYLASKENTFVND